MLSIPTKTSSKAASSASTRADYINHLVHALRELEESKKSGIYLLSSVSHMEFGDNTPLTAHIIESLVQLQSAADALVSILRGIQDDSSSIRPEDDLLSRRLTTGDIARGRREDNTKFSTFVGVNAAAPHADPHLQFAATDAASNRAPQDDITKFNRAARIAKPISASTDPEPARGWQDDLTKFRLATPAVESEESQVPAGNVGGNATTAPLADPQPISASSTDPEITRGWQDDLSKFRTTPAALPVAGNPDNGPMQPMAADATANQDVMTKFDSAARAEPVSASTGSESEPARGWQDDLTKFRISNTISIV